MSQTNRLLATVTSMALKTLITIRKSEWPLALLMATYFFLVITSFWVLKPLKKSLFIQFYDQAGFQLAGWAFSASQAELLAKMLNMVVAFGAVIVFTSLARRFRRQQLTYIFTTFFFVGYGLYSVALQQPGDGAVWSFYLFGDLFSTLMVTTFFAFLNDSVTADAAKRLYGLVGLGGVLGGVFGTTLVRGFIRSLSLSSWLWVCMGLGVLILVVAYLSGRLVQSAPPATSPPDDATSPVVEGDVPSGNPALEGGRLVLRSPYLLSIVGIVGLYEIASTLLDFQFTSTIAHYLDGPAIGAQFSTVFAVTNMVSLCVQLFLTSLIMTKLGVGVALVVLPVAMLMASAGFMAMPVLWAGSLLSITDNGLSYSINQSAKETLYVPTSSDEKYKAKAFIDMFIQRGAKALAVVVSLVVTSVFTDFMSIRWLSLGAIVLVVVWIVIARYAGARFREVTATMD